jgi:apolipoprotein N-acyltransferase
MTRALWVLAFAGVTFASFPQPLAGAVVDLGVLLAWLSPALLALALHGLAPRRAFAVAFVAGLAAQSLVLHWIYVVTVVYGHAPAVVGVAAPIGLAAHAATLTALFGAGAAWLARRRLASPWLLAALWAALDHARHWALSGFPWGVLGYAQWKSAPLMALAEWTGVVGLSFVTALGSLAALDALRALRAGARPSAPTLAALAAVALVHVAGAVAVGRDPAPGGERLRVAVLQGNIDQGVKWSPDWAEETLAIYEDLTRRAAAEGAKVVLWPETAVPGSVETDPSVRERLRDLAATARVTMIVGAVGIERDPAAPADCYQRHCWRYFDSAYVFDRSGDVTDRYDKAHLVPFGEYVPLREVIGLFVSAVARGIAPDNVTAGPDARPVELSPDAPDARALTAGIPICYELLFPDLVRRFVRDGARVLLAITNDAWYGRTGAPYQFLAITALRAAETRTWIARAANTGVSGFLDDRGRPHAVTTIFERDLRVLDVPLRGPDEPRSFYVRHGEVFAFACWAACLGGIAIGARRRGE